MSESVWGGCGEFSCSLSGLLREALPATIMHERKLEGGYGSGRGDETGSHTAVGVDDSTAKKFHSAANVCKNRYTIHIYTYASTR